MKDLSKTPTLAELQVHIDDFCKEKGWDGNSIEQVFLLLTEEVGELARSIRKVTNFGKESNIDTEAEKVNLEEELADCLNYLMEVANRFDVDLATAYKNKFEKNLNRKW